jgi:hypothetical protein
LKLVDYPRLPAPAAAAYFKYIANAATKATRAPFAAALRRGEPIAGRLYQAEAETRQVGIGVGVGHCDAARQHHCPNLPVNAQRIEVSGGMSI